MGPTDNGLKVVIVDDNVSLVDIYKTRLELLGYQCSVAYDGQEALDVIERERPALVLLDLMVPKVAGDQILATMRGSEWGKNIKVLIISNLNEADAPSGLREQGIAGYAVKVNLVNDQLDKMVDSILKPTNQSEDVSLETNPDQPDDAPDAPPPASPAAAPFMATSSSVAPDSPESSSDRTAESIVPGPPSDETQP